MVDPRVRQVASATTLDQAEQDNTYDAIVVGAGAAGSVATSELTAAGLKVLLLDAGIAQPFWQAPWRQTNAMFTRMAANPDFMNFLPLRLTSLGRKVLKLGGKVRQPVQTRCFAWELAPDAFIDDRKAPYSTEKGTPFDWFRAHQLGGKMTIPGHGKQYYRLGPQEISASGEHGAAWPVTYDELSPWYAHVERKLRMSGATDGLTSPPDSVLAKERSPSLAEADLMQQLRAKWPKANPVLGRFAAAPDGLARGAASGHLAIREGAVARRVLVGVTGQAEGVEWFDRRAGRLAKARAPIVFLCAAALESTRILLQSESQKTGRGLGAQSNALGRYLMDHVTISAQGEGDGLSGEPVPNTPGHCVYLPRFDSRNSDSPTAAHGFGMQVYQFSMGTGRSYFNCVSFAEMTPRADNFVELDPKLKDAWGAPALRIRCQHGADDLAMAKDQSEAVREVSDVLNIRLERLMDHPATPGSAIHECGTARMGDDPEISVLDPDNQCWDAKGLYVTDGASFPSQGAQNPTLTIMALTARACAHAVQARPNMASDNTGEPAASTP